MAWEANRSGAAPSGAPYRLRSACCMTIVGRAEIEVRRQGVSELRPASFLEVGLGRLFFLPHPHLVSFSRLCASDSSYHVIIVLPVHSISLRCSPGKSSLSGSRIFSPLSTTCASACQATPGMHNNHTLQFLTSLN